MNDYHRRLYPHAAVLAHVAAGLPPREASRWLALSCRGLLAAARGAPAHVDLRLDLRLCLSPSELRGLLRCACVQAMVAKICTHTRISLAPT